MRHRQAHVFLPSLRSSVGIADEILVEIIHRSRKRRLTTRDRVYFQDKIASANRHGLSNKVTEMLLEQLKHFSRA